MNQSATQVQKLTAPPVISPILYRPKLFQLLNTNKESRITVVAPAGYGKSTFLADWSSKNARKTCWYALQESDNDLDTFLLYLIASIQTVFPSFGKALPRERKDSQRSADTTIDRLIRQVSRLGKPFHWVFEDYHNITNPDIHRCMSELFTKLPSSVVLIVSSRHFLPFPIMRRKLHPRVLQIGVDELAFDQEEASQLSEFLSRQQSSASLESSQVELQIDSDMEIDKPDKRYKKNVPSDSTQLVENAIPLLTQGESDWFLTQCNQLEHIESNPELYLYYCWALVIEGHLDRAEKHMQRLETQIKDNRITEEPLRHKLMPEILLLRSHIGFLQLDFEMMMRYRVQCLVYHPYKSPIIENLDVNSSSPQLTRGFLGAGGDVTTAIQAYGRFLSDLNESFGGDFPSEESVCGFLSTAIAELHLESNRLDEVEEYLLEAMQNGLHMEMPGLYIPSTITYLNWRVVQDPDYDSSGMINDMKIFVKKINRREWMRIVEAFEIRMQLRKNHLSPQAFQLEKSLRDVKGTISLEREYEYLTLCRIYMASEQASKALEIIDRLYTPAYQQNEYGIMIELLMLKSIALHRQGQLADAREALIHALRLGMNKGYSTTFVQEGEALLLVLANICNEPEQEQAFHTYILALYQQMVELSSRSKQEQPDFENLTDREFEILTLVSHGMKNKEIAEKLELTIGSVKVYCHRIFRKLGVSNRTQATVIMNNIVETS